MIVKRYLEKGDTAYTTGAYIVYAGDGKWTLGSMEEDTYFDGAIVNNEETKPYIEVKVKQTHDKTF